MEWYDVIYADPPWRYSFSRSKSRKVENQYDTMTTEEICSLDIPAKKDSVCYLWATAPKLEDALEVMAEWGFTYKTHAVWDKEIMGMGYWFRGQHELLLVGTMGKFPPPATNQRWSSIIKQRRGVHSKKPDLVYQLIELAFPEAKKIELFARGPARAGWDVWGKEAHAT